MKRKKNKPAKNATGKKLTEKAGLAIKHEFYLEASWILSAMFERKLKKLLIQVEKQNPGRGFTLEQLIKRVKYLHVLSRYKAMTAHFSVQLFDEIRIWKNQRNEILKDIPDLHVSPARIERLALEGVKLYKEFNAACKSFKLPEEVSEHENSA